MLPSSTNGTRTILRITRSGAVIPVNFSNSFVMSILDPFNIKGQEIIVWIDDLEHSYMQFIWNIWNLVEDSLEFKSLYKYFDEVESLKSTSGVIIVPMLGVEPGWECIVPLFSVWYELYMGKPIPRETSKFYVSTLTHECWMGELVVIILLILTMSVMYKLHPMFAKISFIKHIGDCFLFTARLITNRAVLKRPKTTSFRIFYLTSTLFGFVFLVFYSALLTSKLSVSVESIEISSVDDIARVRTYHLCLPNGTNFYQKFLTKDGNAFLPEWEGLVNGPICGNTSSLSQILGNACKNKLIALYAMRSIEKNDGTLFDSCVAISLKKKLYKSIAYPLAGKNFPYKELVNKELMKIRSVGLHSYWHTKMVYSPPSPYAYKENYKQVSLQNVTGLLYYFCIITTISAILLVLEIFWKWYRNTKIDIEQKFNKKFHL